jgi:hypothetical protein
MAQIMRKHDVISINRHQSGETGNNKLQAPNYNIQISNKIKRNCFEF